MSIIELRNISKTYSMGGKVEVLALNDVSIGVSEGEFVAIMGPSGSGKSTLLHILGLLDKPSLGSYKLIDKEVSLLSDNELASLRNKFMGFVFQNYNLLARMSAKENVALPKIYFSGNKLLSDEVSMLKNVGLGDRIKHKPNELSGGQQQRVAIARALVNNPLLILADEPTGNLDTKSALEIIDILKELNNSGITIVMVTHEPDLAQAASRIIKLQDGRIISDEKIHPTVAKSQIAKDLDVSRNHYLQKLIKLKKINDYFFQAMHSLVSNKTRSVLSILGVLIGVASLIAMLALGRGAQEKVKKNISNLGSNILSVMPARPFKGGIALESGSVTRLTVEDSEEIRDISGVNRVVPYVNGHGQVVYEGNNWRTRLTGTTADYPLLKNAMPATGRFFTEEENINRQKVAVLGKTVVSELFGDTNPLGESIKINKVDFQVIGTLPEKGAMGPQDQDDQIIIPLNTAMYRLLGRKFIDYIDVQVNDTQVMDLVSDRIKKLIVSLHRLSESKEDTIDIIDMAEIQATITSTVNTFAYLLGAIAFISLLVGGIGIMNIMFVSVTERTREIGLRKAIGASNKDILFQFVIESVVICILGG
ncbi:MAG: ABC transporter permease, partial [Elusimicrobiota bacterium]